MGSLKRSALRIACSSVVAATLLSQPVSAAKPSPVEIAVKATFLTKFTSYLNWPSRSLSYGAPIVICVIGRDPFGPALEQAVTGETSGSHPLVLRRYQSASEVNKCHLAYLSGSGRDVSAALASANTSPVVTVTDSRNSNVSGVIHFQLIGGSVKFDINTTAASRAGVGISSKLLGLARKVRRTNAR